MTPSRPRPEIQKKYGRNIEVRNRFLNQRIELGGTVHVPGTLAPIKMDNTRKFSDRVQDYVKYRPPYPEQLIGLLNQYIGLDRTKIVADIGSGTGISSVPFLQNGNMVYGVEPNDEMRQAQEILLAGYGNFVSVNGTAESTNLKSEIADLIFCGQAFHWFDREHCKKEFFRILKYGGNIVLAWNFRRSKTRFLQDYEQILVNNLENYRNSHHRNIDDLEIQKFFSPNQMHSGSLDNEQTFDLDGLKGRLKSSSYCPNQGKEYESIMNQIEKLFEKYEEDNRIVFQYETKVYWC